MSPRRPRTAPAHLFARRIATPLGEMLAFVDADGALRQLEFVDSGRIDENEAASARAPEAAARTADALQTQLTEYFARRRRRFELPLDPAGTRFQRRVWSALQKIPYGAVTSYGELAEHLGDPRAIRAVGRANGANPIAIVIPCHRVIGADGSLVGYGGGLERKRALLELEGAVPPASQQASLFDDARSR